MRMLLATVAVFACSMPAVAYLPPPSVLNLERAASLTSPEDELPMIDEYPEESLDEIHTFMGYTPDMWDELPTLGDIDCPDEQCLVDTIESALVTAVLYEFLRHDAADWQFFHGQYLMSTGLATAEEFRSEFVMPDAPHEFLDDPPLYASAFQ